MKQLLWFLFLLAPAASYAQMWYNSTDDPHYPVSFDLTDAEHITLYDIHQKEKWVKEYAEDIQRQKEQFQADLLKKHVPDTRCGVAFTCTPYMKWYFTSDLRIMYGVEVNTALPSTALTTGVPVYEQHDWHVTQQH